ncbi:MAG: YncE family protein, partial [Dehalococcoidia bacterium]
MRLGIKSKPILLGGMLVALAALAAVLAAACAGKEEAAAPVIQVGNPEAQAPASAAPSGWDTEWSQLMGVRLLQTFDSSGPALWEAADHPLVYFASEGPGYGGLLSSGVSLPGYQVIDAKTHEILAAPHFDLGVESHFEPHGLGVSPDGRWVYVPTAAGSSFRGAKEAGRLLIVDARTGKLAQILQVPGRPHHIKSFVDSQGNDRVLAYSWNYGAYILDPKDQNRVVGAVPNGILLGRGYLAFVDPSGRWLFYTVRPPREVEAQGSVAIVDIETWEYVRSIGVEDSSPIFVAFTGDGKTAFVTGGHESKVTKIDMSEEDPADWELVKVARAGTEGPYGLNLNWEEDLIITIGKGEGSHNKGITVGLVDPRMVGRARPM